MFTLGLYILSRDSQIRTDDILLPKQTLYQAELHPELTIELYCAVARARPIPSRINGSAAAAVIGDDGLEPHPRHTVGALFQIMLCSPRLPTAVRQQHNTIQ